MAKKTFEFDPLFGTLFPGAKYWAGSWSETGGEPTHDTALGGKDGVMCVAFRKVGSKGWTHCPITFAAEGDDLAARNHKGFVVFKGNKLNLWRNYAKGHDNDPAHERLDLKPVQRSALPF